MSETKSLDTLYRPIAAALDDVRETINGLWQDALRLVHMEGAPPPKAGGKLLRPALCLLSAGASGAPDPCQYARLGVAFEALHIASLTHDDVIDHAILRRGNASLNALWDNHAAVLGGDYLVARAVQMLAEYGCCEVIATAITCVRRMAEGELFFFGREEDSIRPEDCIMLAEQKTASLFAEACAAPARLLGGGFHDALHRFGIGLGIAFQIVDDLIDLTQNAETLGKPACGDIVEGKHSLPIVLMRQRLDDAGRNRLQAMRGAELSGADREWVMEQLRATQAGDVAQAAAHTHIRKAKDALLTLPDSAYRQSMEGLADFILVRVS